MATRSVALAAVLALLAALAPSAAPAREQVAAATPLRRPDLPSPPAPRLSPAEIEALAATTPRDARGPAPELLIDTSSRLAVVAAWAREYVPSEDFADHLDWTGDVGACNEGANSAELAADVLRRINWYRAQAGVKADITAVADKDQKCAEAALVMSRQDDLSHTPLEEFAGNPCLSEGADTGANRSNLALGNQGPRAIDRLMIDRGNGNTSVGHRRWTLYPRMQTTGNGSIPENDDGPAAHAQWVIGDFRSSPPPFPVMWPNQGFIPWQVVPDDEEDPARWSFTYPGADFSLAVVTVERLGDGAPEPVATQRETPRTGFGDNTLVWRMTGVPAVAPGKDTVYRVTVESIQNAPWTNFVYEVVVIDPADLQVDFVPEGLTTVSTSGSWNYDFEGLDEIDGYDVRVTRAVAGTWNEGAENDDHVVDRTSSGYSLRSTTLASAGARSFHLAIPSLDENEQSFEIARSVVPGAASELRFKQRMRFATFDTRLSAQVALDGSGAWRTVWRRDGANPSNTSNDWDTAWSEVAAPIPAFYEGSAVRVRFLLRVNGSTFVGTSGNFGFFIDEVRVTDSDELLVEEEQQLPAGAEGFTFSSETPGDVLLQVQATIGEVSFGFGTPLAVTVVDGPVSTTTTLPPVLCGDADGNGRVTAPDALNALKTAVGSGSCPASVCDVLPPAGVSAGDALAILKHVVGLLATLDCSG